MMDSKIIALLEEMKTNCLKPDSTDPKRHDKAEALNFAIFMLKRRESAGEQMAEYAAQIKWERDIAIGQLEDIGKSFGEVMDDVAKVVRCSECIHRYKLGENVRDSVTVNMRELRHARVQSDDFFCADGERRNG